MNAHQQQPLYSQSSEAGFTIIESLLAILVVTILMVGLGPVIALSTATRVQAKRVELGAQAAKSYIDGVRSGAIAPTSNTAKQNELADFLSPSSAGTLSLTTNQYDSATVPKLYCIDGDGDNKCLHTSSYDMVVQAVRSDNNPSEGYRMAVRVYRADAFNDATALKTKTAQRSYSGGTGARKAPVMETTTEIAPSQPKLKDLCARLGCGR